LKFGIYANPISASVGAAFGSLSDLNGGKNYRQFVVIPEIT
jgi:hypothetical protein